MEILNYRIVNYKFAVCDWEQRGFEMDGDIRSTIDQKTIPRNSHTLDQQANLMWEYVHSSFEKLEETVAPLLVCVYYFFIHLQLILFEHRNVENVLRLVAIANCEEK